MRYAASVAHAANMKTARRAMAYESRAARCRCGGRLATKRDECRIARIFCHIKKHRELINLLVKNELSYLSCIGFIYALLQFTVEDGLEDCRRDTHSSDLPYKHGIKSMMILNDESFRRTDTSKELTEARPYGHYGVYNWKFSTTRCFVQL